MIYMKKILLTGSFLFFVFFLHPTFGSAQSSELDRLVMGLQKKYNRLRSLSVDFTQIYTSPREGTRREGGRLLLRKPGRMRWDYNYPETKIFVSNGRVMYEWVPTDKYATKTSVKESEDMRAPFMFLLGRGDLRGEFKLIEFARESPARAGNKVLRMIPKKTQEFRELLIEVNPNTLQLSRLSFVDGDDGARSDFLFSNVRENIPAKLELFSFKAPPGVEVREID
jgi:outer membrane lipoprotein carrier protein